MITKRELENVVTEINVILERIDKRLKLVESTQHSLLHDLKQEMVKTARGKKNG